MQLLSGSVWTNKSWWTQAGSVQTHLGVSVLCFTFQGILLAWLGTWIWTCFVQISWRRWLRRPPESGVLEESWYRDTEVLTSPEGPTLTSLMDDWFSRLCFSAFLAVVVSSGMLYYPCIQASFILEDVELPIQASCCIGLATEQVQGKQGSSWGLKPGHLTARKMLMVFFVLD